MEAIGIFVGIFVGSALLGAAIAFLAVVSFRTGYFNPMLSIDGKRGGADEETPPNSRSLPHPLPHPMMNDALTRQGSLRATDPFQKEPEEHVNEESSIYETVVVIVTGLCAYMCSAALGLSGITAIVVAGMIMSCYVAPNLSPISQEWVRVVSMGESLIAAEDEINL